MRCPIRTPLILLATALALARGPATLAAPGPDGVDPLASTPLAIPIEPIEPLPKPGTPDDYLFNLRWIGADAGRFGGPRNLSRRQGPVGGDGRG